LALISSSKLTTYASYQYFKMVKAHAEIIDIVCIQSRVCALLVQEGE
jgi:hypothetical protein